MQAPTTVANEGTESNIWEIPRKKIVQKPKEKVQLSVFNRFSYWEDESDVEDIDDDDDASDEITLPPRDVQSKWWTVKCQGRRQRVKNMKQKKNYKTLETHNSFYVFQQHTEDGIGDIINGKNPTKSDGAITKCNSCSFKRGCSTNQSACKVNGKKCDKCLKPNHFPK